MSLFEFLMILLSIFVGLGLSQILISYANVLREDREHQFSFVHTVLSAAIFLGLLQTFWETWGLRDVETWTFPGMLMMLSSPICLLTAAHVLFPPESSHRDLGEHYLAKAPLLWALAAGAVVFGTLFRPLAFGMPLLVWDNVSSLPMLALCMVLATSRSKRIHDLLAPLVIVIIALDTLLITYLLS